MNQNMNDMKNGKTLYHFILDSSGSMAHDRVNTVNLFNRQVATVRALSREYPDQQFLTGLTVFNDQVTHLLQETPVHLLRELDMETYRPEGYTALFDAIGGSIDRIRDFHGPDLGRGRMTVVMIVLTDGHENASRKYDRARIAKMFQDLQATDQWTFTVLGADFDITQVSDDLNLARNSSFNYAKSDFRQMAIDVEDSIKRYAAQKSQGRIDKDYFRKTDGENQDGK